MSNAQRDQNSVPTLLGVSSVDLVTPTTIAVNPVTHRVLVDLPGGGTGTVTSVSVVTANGVSGSVATATTTPAITLTLGAITPSSVNAVVISGSSTPTLAVTGTTTVSGSNTGDQTNISGNAATVTTNANLTGPITSSGNATSIASQTGTGTKFVMDTSPTLITPALGIASATSLGVAGIITTGANGGTAGSITFSGSTSGTTVVQVGAVASGVLTLPAVTGTLTVNTATQTLTNKRLQKRVVATTQSATPTINTDNGDIFEIVGLAQAVTSMTTNLSGTPLEGEMIQIIFKDDGTARAITWGASFVAQIALPTTTVISTPLSVTFQYRTSAVWTATSAWYCMSVA